jgi:hypothetical protein
MKWSPDAPELLKQKDMLLYDDLVAFRGSNPSRFDKEHPFFGKLLSDPSYMNAVVDRWEDDEERFEYWHPYLWQILNAYVNQPQPIGPPPLPPPGQQGNGETGGGSNGGGDSQPGGGGGNGSAIPEPPSGFLLLLAVSAVLFSCAWTRQRFGLPSLRVWKSTARGQ